VAGSIKREGFGLVGRGEEISSGEGATICRTVLAAPHLFHDLVFLGPYGVGIDRRG
jgi:hypothetical protein